jgi:Na+/H+-dicarboxylate symporter
VVTNIIAVIVGIAAMGAAEQGFGVSRPWAFLLGVLAILIAKYVAYAIRVRLQMRSDIEQAKQAVERGWKKSN